MSRSHSLHTLHALLEQNLGRAPEYRGAFSNHLPMALQALHALGAGDARLRDYAAGYLSRRQLVPADAANAAPFADWAAERGRIESFAALRAGFTEQLRSGGLDATLRAALPLLWPGMVGAALHGVIRTAHAVQSAHEGEIAAGLAYWAARWQALPIGPPSSTPMPFAAWSRELEAAAAQTRSSAASIATRVGAAAGGADFALLSAALAIEAEPDLLRRLSHWAASLYARSANFTVLHAVTGLRAVRVLQPWLGDAGAALPALVRAVTAAVLASNLQARSDAVVPLEWDAIRAAAIADEDEHVIKLVHACAEGHAVDGDAVWQQAASRAVSGEAPAR